MTDEELERFIQIIRKAHKRKDICFVTVVLDDKKQAVYHTNLTPKFNIRAISELVDLEGRNIEALKGSRIYGVAKEIISQLQEAVSGFRGFIKMVDE